MKINHKILNLPPYISTSWDNISALHMKETLLIVSLKNGESITIPGLSPELIEKIFDSHSAYLEQPPHTKQHKKSPFAQPGLHIVLPFQLDSNSIESLESMIEHNPSQANAPDLPSDVLDKVQSFAKLIPLEEVTAAPKPEPHCNCVHCQISRAIHQGIDAPEEEPEQLEEITEDVELSEWNIEQSGDKLYTLTHKLNSNEQYQVYLGEPVGCTCGKEGCEHIVTVLKS